MKTSVDLEPKIVKLYPLSDIGEGKHQVDLYNNEGELILKIQAVELPEKLELKDNEVLVKDPAKLFRIALREINGKWQSFVGLKVLTLRIIKGVVEIVNEISGINYCLVPNGRPGDEPPSKERRENEDRRNSSRKIWKNKSNCC